MAVVVPLEVLKSKVALLGDEAAHGHSHCAFGLEQWRGHCIKEYYNFLNPFEHDVTRL